MAKGKLHTGPKGGKYRIKGGKKVYEKKKGAAAKKKSPAPRKIHRGKNGGEYYIRKGKRVYLKPETPQVPAGLYAPAILGSMQAMPSWWKKTATAQRV